MDKHHRLKAALKTSAAGRGRPLTASGIAIAWLACAGLLLVSAGCSRAFYRRQADAEAYALVQEKACDPGWPLEAYSIEIAPESRMYDPFDRDYPPMPPDDPTAHRLMHCIDCKKGYPCWHANGDTPTVQGPNWLSALPRTEENTVLIDQDTAVRLALVNAPQYQRELEDLYLSALDVSFERFRFDTQFFGGTDTFFTADGADRGVRGGSSASSLDIDSALTARKLFATGGELVVGLANSLMWQFSGPNTNQATSLLDFTLVQPLLRTGGRPFVLERLTIAERVLLSNVRQMERFRRGFFINIVTGGSAGAGPSRRGGVLGTSGLEGFSGIGGGGFGQLGGGGALGVTGGAGAGQAGGFLGLLQQQKDISNQRANVTALTTSVAQLEAFFGAGRIDFFQVELARQALFNAQSRLLNSQIAYQNQLDEFKIQLGLPPYLDFQLDERFIEPFELYDPRVIDLQDQLTQSQRLAGEIITGLLERRSAAAAQAGSGAKVPPGPASAAASANAGGDDEMAGIDRLLQIIRQAQSIRQIAIREQLPQAGKDIDDFEASLDGRDEELQRLRNQIRQRLLETRDQQISDEELKRELQRPGALRVSRSRGGAGQTAVEPGRPGWAIRGNPHAVGRDRTRPGRSTGTNETRRGGRRNRPEGHPEEGHGGHSRAVGRTVFRHPQSFARAGAARAQTVRLVPVEVEWQQALEIARIYRRDWMNARASLVDSWRLIQFNANDLESDLDVVFAGDISTFDDNPVDFRSSRGRLRVGLEFDAPLTRVAERNDYRQSLIEYQQARRAYYQFEDSITAGLRDILRQLNNNQINFELRRVAVEIAIGQVELTRLRLQEPPRPGAEGQFGATTARDLVTALSDLLNVQNDFLSVWINHESLRRVLDFNLGTMQLDCRGMWVDPGAILKKDNRYPIVPPASGDEDDSQIERLPDLSGGAAPGMTSPPGTLPSPQESSPPLFDPPPVD